MMWSIKRNTASPILDIADHRVFAANGNLLLCYQLELPEIYTLSERDFEALHTTWFQGLKSLPAGTVVHKQDVYEKASFNAMIDLAREDLDFINEVLSSNHFKMTDGERAEVLKEKEAKSREMVTEIEAKTKRYAEIISFREMQNRLRRRRTGY